MFQGGRAAGDSRFQPWLLGLALLEQAGYLLPWIWFPLVLCLISALHGRRREDRYAERFLLWPVGDSAGLICDGRDAGTRLAALVVDRLRVDVSAFGRAMGAASGGRSGRFRRAIAAPAIIPPLLVLLVVAQARWDLLSRIGLSRFPEIAQVRLIPRWISRVGRMWRESSRSEGISTNPGTS